MYCMKLLDLKLKIQDLLYKIILSLYMFISNQLASLFSLISPQQETAQSQESLSCRLE